MTNRSRSMSARFLKSFLTFYFGLAIFILAFFLINVFSIQSVSATSCTAGCTTQAACSDAANSVCGFIDPATCGNLAADAKYYQSQYSADLTTCQQGTLDPVTGNCVGPYTPVSTCGSTVLCYSFVCAPPPCACTLAGNCGVACDDGNPLTCGDSIQCNGSCVGTTCLASPSPSPTPTPTSSPGGGLSCTLSASPSSGTATFTPTLNMTISGLDGDISQNATLAFDCTNNGTWDFVDTRNDTITSYSTTACSYGSGGTYTVKAQVTSTGTNPGPATCTTSVSVATPTPTPAPGSLVGRVIKDDNGNGIFDSGEQFIEDPTGAACSGSIDSASGFNINWSGPSSGSTKVLLCNPQPYYDSGALTPGTYSAWITAPAGWTIIGTNPVTVPIFSGAQTNQWFFVQPLNNPPTASSVTATPADACVAGPAVTVSWVYSDPDGDPQSAYQVQVDEQGKSFNPPIYDSGKVLSSSNAHYVSGLPLAKTLQARVKVWDSKGLASTVWAYSNSWKTVSSTPPAVSFIWYPPNPGANQDIQFTDQSTCYDVVATGAPCTGKSPGGWLWLFKAPANPPSATVQNPIYKYGVNGSYNVSLTVTDSKNTACTLTKPISIQKPIPIWKEISPK